MLGCLMRGMQSIAITAMPGEQAMLVPCPVPVADGDNPVMLVGRRDERDIL